jgi:peptidoglycan/LPS O-acetylase OafA/YrhL
MHRLAFRTGAVCSWRSEGRDLRRIDSLDALRGIAALIVVVFHCISTMPGLYEAAASTWILRPLFAGQAAVYLFFVLSGFVLFVSVERQHPIAFLPFVIKRVMRIYPPLVAIILASASAFILVQPHPIAELSVWFNHHSWNTFPTAKVLAGHFLLLDGVHYQNLDMVIWSLAHELRISVIFPLLAITVRRMLWTSLAATLLISLAAFQLDPPREPHTWIDLIGTLKFVVLFVAGAGLAKKRHAVEEWAADARHRIPMRLLLVASVILLSIDTEGPFPLLIGLGALGTVAVCFADPAARRFLSWPPLIWLGRLSYSLYLVHLVVLLTIVHAFHESVPVPVLLLAVLPLSLLAAELLFRTVEMPSIRLGRWVSRSSNRPAYV